MSKKYVDVPLGGNSFITNKPQSAPDHITPSGWRRWSNSKYEYHVYFKTAAEADVRLKLLISKAKNAAVIKASVPGERTVSVTINPGDKEADLGAFHVGAGYVDVKIQGVQRDGGVFASPSVLRVEGITDEPNGILCKKIR